jgi:hypothetical protein
MSTVNNCGHEGKGDRPGAPPVWWQGHGGEDTPSEPESLGGDDEEEDEDEEEGEVTPLPHSSLPEDLPSLGASSASKWGSSSACAGQNSPRQRPGHRPAHHRSPALHWYLLTYRG